MGILEEIATLVGRGERNLCMMLSLENFSETQIVIHTLGLQVCILFPIPFFPPLKKKTKL